MKARHIAPGRNSLYAIDHADELWVIKRNEDGQWDRWQRTSVNATGVVHGGSVLVTLDTSSRVSVLQLGSGAGGRIWDRHASEIVALHTPAQGPMVFAVDRDIGWRTSKHSPTAPWSEWESLGGPVRGLQAEVIPGGGPALFGLRNRDIFYRWQAVPLGDWTEWASLGGPPSGATLLRVSSIRGGGLVVFALGEDGSIYHRWQDKPLDLWQPWWPLGGVAKDFVVSKTPSGGLAVFTIGPDDTVRYRFQSKPFGDWGPWKRLEGRFRHLAVQTSYLEEGLEVFAIDLNDEIYHSWRDRSDGPWTAWKPLDHEPAVERSVPTGPSAGRT